jgi:uncharacterized membrane protein YsdA (DUF1294 family)
MAKKKLTFEKITLPLVLASYVIIFLLISEFGANCVWGSFDLCHCAILFVHYQTLGIICATIMFVDKVFARCASKRRFSEKLILVICMSGGFPGIITGMIFFCHKTLKPKFWVVATLSLMLHGLLTVFLTCITT